jgi:hypothetical protein
MISHKAGEVETRFTLASLLDTSSLFDFLH